MLSHFDPIRYYSRSLRSFLDDFNFIPLLLFERERERETLVFLYFIFQENIVLRMLFSFDCRLAPYREHDIFLFVVFVLSRIFWDLEDFLISLAETQCRLGFQNFSRIEDR